MEEAKENPKKKRRHTGDISNLLHTAARFNDSERKMVAYHNALRKDDGHDLKENPSMILTKSKVQAAKKKTMTNISNEPAQPTSAIFADGKKFPTLHNDPVEDLPQSHSLETDDHYAIADGERQEFLGDVVVERGSGEAIADGILDFVEETPGLDIDDVSIFGGDSTNLNVGRHGGFIAVIEQRLNRPFHRFICLLHIIELLLRHIVGHYVGPTSGPRSFCSDLGKAIVQLSSPVIASFRKIPCPSFPQLPDDVLAVGRPVLFDNFPFSVTTL